MDVQAGLHACCTTDSDLPPPSRWVRTRVPPLRQNQLRLLRSYGGHVESPAARPYKVKCLSAGLGVMFPLLDLNALSLYRECHCSSRVG